MDLTELKRLHDKAFTYGQITRERAADDLVFYYITQWDDNILSESQLKYRGEFNILKKAGRQIISDLASNPIQIDFVPVDETREDSAELADGLYRKDDNHNTSIESYENGKAECIVCGAGAWELRTEYVSARNGNKNQVIRRYPILEANNNVLWDPNATLMDKSDARYVSILTAYSRDGYKDLVKELTGEETDVVASNFKFPEHSYSFPWIGGEGEKIYVATFYHRKKTKDKLLTMVDPFGQSTLLRESSLSKVMDEMLDMGYSVEEEKQIERWKVIKYIASGERIIDESIIPGENIPVIPIFGEYAYVEGEPHWEGVTRLAKDPQRLRNFQLSYLADIVSQSPRQQPIFFPEQLQGFEYMYNQAGIESRYPYLLQNRKDEHGNDLPIGPVAEMPAQPIPQALAASIDISRQAVEYVANPGIAQDIADPDLSGKAVLALHNRLDMQSTVYQNHFKHAKRRDGEVWAGMASEIYDVPRKTQIELPDGTKKDVDVMEAVIDEETGNIVFLNDMRNAEFEVFSKIGSDYTSQKEQTLDDLQKLIVSVDQSNPLHNALILKVLALRDGVEFEDIREYANTQLVLTGIKKPETPEEEKSLAASTQNAKKEDPAMVLAKAEELKGQADIMREKREGIKMQLENTNAQTKNNIDVFKAQTERIKALAEAKKAGATIHKTDIEATGIQLDNATKIKDLNVPLEI